MKKELPLYERKILQDPQEIEEFCSILRDEDVSSYLELGAKFGGSFWKVATTLPRGSRVVAVDLPNGTRAWQESQKSLLECIGELKRRGYDAKVIWGNSQDQDVIKQAGLYAPYDCIFIDADHRLPGVTADWDNYSWMASQLIVLHDIAWRRAPEWDEGYRIDVPQFWNEIKGSYRHREIKHCHTGKDNGIGVVWKD